MIINADKKNYLTKRILKFIYYLRYLIFIFIIFTVLIFTIPKIFNYVNKIERLNLVLKNQHGFSIEKFKKVNYKIFPQPNLEIKNIQVTVDGFPTIINIERIKIFTNIKNLYYSGDNTFNKIKFEVNFLGNNITGYYLPKKNVNLLYFDIKNLGIKSKIFFDNKKKLSKPSGIMKLSILDYNLLLNFSYDKTLNLKDSIFKNKDINTNFNGQLNFEPFFYFNILADVNRVKNLNLKIKKFYDLIINEISEKKLNGEFNVNYLPKKIIGKKSNQTNKINLQFKNGDIFSQNSILEFAGLNIKLNFYLKRYPTYKELDYNISIKTDNINTFLKKIGGTKLKDKKKIQTLIAGNINLDAQKYYFQDIIINETKFKKKDLIYLKNYFDTNAIDLFNSNLDEENIYLFLKNLIDPT